MAIHNKNRKKRRPTATGEMNLKIKARKADVERIVAIADYFLSTVDESSYEYRALNHTTEFYSQLNNLVKQGYLRTHTPKKNDPSVVNYLAMVDYALIEEIAEDLDIRLFEYLYRGAATKQSG